MAGSFAVWQSKTILAIERQFEYLSMLPTSLQFGLVFFSKQDKCSLEHERARKLSNHNSPKATARSRISSERWEQTPEMGPNASGIGLREIARELGIPEAMAARAKREGWTLQIQSAKALTKARGICRSLSLRLKL